MLEVQLLSNYKCATRLPQLPPCQSAPLTRLQLWRVAPPVQRSHLWLQRCQVSHLLWRCPAPPPGLRDCKSWGKHWGKLGNWWKMVKTIEYNWNIWKPGHESGCFSAGNLVAASHTVVAGWSWLMVVFYSVFCLEKVNEQLELGLHKFQMGFWSSFCCMFWPNPHKASW